MDHTHIKLWNVIAHCHYVFQVNPSSWLFVQPIDTEFLLSAHTGPINTNNAKCLWKQTEITNTKSFTNSSELFTGRTRSMVFRAHAMMLLRCSPLDGIL